MFCDLDLLREISGGVVFSVFDYSDTCIFLYFHPQQPEYFPIYLMSQVRHADARLPEEKSLHIFAPPDIIHTVPQGRRSKSEGSRQNSTASGSFRPSARQRGEPADCPPWSSLPHQPVVLNGEAMRDVRAE